MQERPIERLVHPLYVVAALMIAIPIMDYLSNVLPLQPGNFEWRYEAVGEFSGIVPAPVIGFIMFVVLAAYARHRTLSRVVGMVNVVLAVGLFAASALFVLDVLQVRNDVTEAGLGDFYFGVVKTLVGNLTVGAALVWLGLVEWRIGKHVSRRSRPYPEPVIVGRRPQSAAWAVDKQRRTG